MNAKKIKGVETFKATIYTTFFIMFAFFLFILFLKVGAREKNDVLGALNSDIANRIANSINLLQTYEYGAVELDLPGKYIIKRSEKYERENKLHYIEVAFKNEKNSANSKAFKLDPQITIYPPLTAYVTGGTTTEVDIAGYIATKENPGNKICVIKIKDNMYVFNMENPTYAIPNTIDKEKCSIK